MAKILFVTHLMPMPGARRITTALYNLIKFWPKEELTILRVTNVIWDKHCFRRRVIDEEPRTIVWPFLKLRYFTLNIDLACSTFDFSDHDIVLSHCATSHEIAGRISEKFRIPHVLGIHGTDANRLLHQRRESGKLRKYIANAVALTFRSSSLKKTLEKLVDISGKATFIANSGISRELIEEGKRRSEVRTTNRLIFVGRLLKLKNVDKVLYALADLLDFDWTFRIIGSGPEAERIAAVVEETGLSDRVALEDWKPHEQILEEMAASDIFVMVSAPETFGLVYLEAMVNGCITVGAKGWGIDGVIEDGRNGFLCDAESIEDIRQKLGHIMSMGLAERERVVGNAYETLEDYTEENRSLSYHEFLTGLV